MTNHERHGLRYRPGTADENVLADVFDRNQYSLDGLPIKAPPRSPLIVDAGAHIGAASRWFTKKYAQAWVVAYEAEHSNAALLRENARTHRIFPAVGAIMSRRRWYQVTDPDQGNWGYRVEACDDGTSQAMTIGECLESFPYCHPWIVKIDIEGGEAELFSDNTAWVDQVPVIQIELHDWLIPGAGDAWRALRPVRSRHEFNRGETTISVRWDWLK